MLGVVGDLLWPIVEFYAARFLSRWRFLFAACGARRAAFASDFELGAFGVV